MLVLLLPRRLFFYLCYWCYINYPFQDFTCTPCGSAGKESACNEEDLGLIPGLGWSAGEGKGCPLQCSGLKNSMDYTVHKIAESGMTEQLSPSLSFFLSFYFIFKLYNIVLVLPYINMNLPQVYTCCPSWTLLPPPSLYHPSGSSQCTSPKHPVSCIEPVLCQMYY